jgi:putative ABC transport system permease protein
MTELVGFFALAALILALTGIYAVVSFSVTMRAQEIAIRMALGAQRESIVRFVLRSGVRLALVGSGLGGLVALGTSQLMRSYLFSVSPTDPWLYAASIFVMIGIAFIASAIPAIRAASADPIKALRSVN